MAASAGEATVDAVELGGFSAAPTDHGMSNAEARFDAPDLEGLYWAELLSVE